MHGQRRDEYKARMRDPATSAKLAQKAETWNNISGQLLQRRRNAKNETSVEAKSSAVTLGLTEKLLFVNPDPAYLWNHRREVLCSTSSTLSPSEFIEQEQILTQNALQRNPKAYGAWFHRKWAIRRYIELLKVDAESTTQAEQTRLLKAELGLCGEFLILDERNFHCWNYRRFVIGTLINSTMTNGNVDDLDGAWDFDGLLQIDCDFPMIGAQLTKDRECTQNIEEDVQKKQKVDSILKLMRSEWVFTTEKVYQNFSNGSAFHYRSKLLPLLMQLDSVCEAPSMTKANVFEEELELIRNAIFTEPDDQTSWWYFRFILCWANPQNEDELDDDALETFQSVLYDEWNSINELVEGEDGGCKWGLLGLHMIASAFCSLDDENHYESENWSELAESYVL